MRVTMWESESGEASWGLGEEPPALGNFYNFFPKTTHFEAY